jgi:hypothetical protein
LSQITFFVDGLPALVDLCGFQLYRLAADDAAKKIRSEKNIKGGGHVKASVAIIRLHKRPTPGVGTAEGCV